MTDQHASSPTTDALDAPIAQLLACGGALSQIIAHMQEFEASGSSSRDAPPILEVAHSLIRDVNSELPNRHTDQEIRVCASIVDEMTKAICENTCFIPPSELRRMSGGHSRSAAARGRKRPSGRRRR